MGLRFYRRLRLGSGLTLNLSKRGASVSVGRRGFHVTAGTSGTRETIGLPGTGVYYTAAQHRRRRAAKHGSFLLGLVVLYVVGYVIWHMIAGG